MTDDQGRGTGQSDGPWSVDVLADLHAGALDEEATRRLGPRANADPQARAVLQALDDTRAQLAAVDAEQPEPIPDAVAARLDTAIAGEQRARQRQERAAGQQAAGQQAVVDLAAARHRRRKRVGWAAGVVAAAAAIAAVVAVAIPRVTGPGNPPLAGPEPTLTAVPTPGNGGNPPLAVSSGQLKQAAPNALGARDYGPMDDRQRLAGCLAANGAGSPQDVAGIKQLRLDGKPGVLMLLTTGKAGQFRLLVVSPGCARGNPATMSNSVIGSPVPPTR